ncbi:hypothetical protein [Stigmatella hybrida]|uniref:hypothetical protein n=1 Tax=Stigmatella hybrida TaxID=394097 RepID=UPI001CDAD84C|nr:hypothetical protein [Stigmatella hybrida]
MGARILRPCILRARIWAPSISACIVQSRVSPVVARVSPVLTRVRQQGREGFGLRVL